MPDQRYKHLPFDILTEKNLIIVKPFGELSFDDLVGHVEDFMEHEDFRAGMNIIYDLRQVSSLEGKLQTLMDSTETLNCSEFIPIPAKTVFYVHDDCSIGRVLEGFCIMTRYTRIPHYVTHSLEDAFNLLGVELLPEHFCQT